MIEAVFLNLLGVLVGMGLVTFVVLLLDWMRKR